MKEQSEMKTPTVGDLSVFKSSLKYIIEHAENLEKILNKFDDFSKNQLNYFTPKGIEDLTGLTQAIKSESEAVIRTIDNYFS